MIMSIIARLFERIPMRVSLACVSLAFSFYQIVHFLKKVQGSLKFMKID